MRVVDAALNNGGGHEHVDVAALEPHHHVLDLLGTHLAVCHAHAGLRRGLERAGLGLVDGLDAVGHVVDLPLALELAADRGAHHVRVELAHGDLDRQAPRRRRHDHRHVAHAAHGHLHGARDGRGREGQHVDLLTHVLELLLVLHAKALLLVHDDEAQVVRVDISREQPVRAHEHGDAAVGEALERLALLLGRAEA